MHLLAFIQPIFWRKLATPAFVALRALLVTGMLASVSQAHELQTNRVMLVLRDSHHLSLTFFIDYVDAIYDTLAPELPFEKFVMVHSAMPPVAFKQALIRAHQKLEADTQLTGPGGKALALTNWRWPDAVKVQDALKQRAMRMVVGSKEPHIHEPAVEVQAEATASTTPTSVTLKLPEVLQPALLVSYRPAQVWIGAKSGAKTVRF
jgi:hypothetical protein